MRLSPSGIPYTTTDSRKYSAMLSVLTCSTPVSTSELAKLWPPCDKFTNNLTSLAAWLLDFSNLYQLSLHGNAMIGWHCEGPLLRRRLCAIDCLAFLHRYSSDNRIHHFSSSLQQRLLQVQMNRASYDNINLTALLDYCVRALDRQYNPHNHAILIDLIKLSLCDLSQHALTFSLTQLAWIRSKAEYLLLVKILGYWQRLNGITLRQYDCEYWALMLHLIYPPEEQDFTLPCQRDLLEFTREFLREFSQITDLPYPYVHQSVLGLYRHFHFLVIRQYLALSPIDSSKKFAPTVLLNEHILQTISSMKKNLISPLTSAETLYLARKLVELITPALDYQPPKITILTNKNNRLEQNISIEISASYLLPVDFQYQSVENFQRYGVQQNTVLVLSLYLCRLPLYFPPLLQVQIPFDGHQKRYVNQFLKRVDSRLSA